MQANVFSIEETRQYILFWQEIHSFISITDRILTPACQFSVFTIESAACNLVIICFRIPKWAEQLLARLVVCMYTYLVCSPFMQLISQEISQATSSWTFLTRSSILETIEYGGSRIEAWGTVNLPLSGTVSFFCMFINWVEAYKLQEKNRDQYPAILTEQAKQAWSIFLVGHSR